MAEENKILDWQEELSNKVMSEWEKGRTYVSDLDDLYETLYKMLRGERPEKNYDWESNLVINKAFQVVWTAIPYFVQKIFGATPIVGVKSYDEKGAWQREEILEFWHNLQPGNSSEHVPYFLIVSMWLLRAMLNGVGIIKKTWHQKLKTEVKETQVVVPTEIDADGNEINVEPHTIKNKITIPIEDWPHNVVCNNKDIVSDWLLQPTQSIRQGRFVIHRALIDLETLYSSKINYINLDDIDPNLKTASSISEDHADLKGKDGQEEIPESDFYTDVEVYERVGKVAVYKDKKDGQWIPCFDKDEMFEDNVIHKEMVVAIARMAGSEDKNNVLIRFEPNENDEINYIDIHLYLDAERWNSIGMLEPAKDMFTAINDNINAMFDEIWQNLFPPVIVNKHALWDWDTMQYAPRQRWLLGGSIKDSIHFKEPSNITRDAWQKHALLDNEVQQTTVTNAMKGAGKEKTATTNVLNAQLTADKLDFLVKMIEVTGIIPSAQMDIRFAKKFVHPITFRTILGEDFKFADWEEYYRYIPAASSVKMEHQREREIQEDIQLIQIASSIPNPNTPKVLNMLFSNILRNRNQPREAELFDPNYYEAKTDSGQLQMLDRMTGAASNEQGVPMSGAEKGVRQQTFKPRVV